MADEVESRDVVRIDRWLWSARFYKSRALAADACDGGKVEVNGHTAKPHSLSVSIIKYLLPIQMVRKEITVMGLAERRGPASEARLLYEDHSPPPPPQEARPFFVPPPLRPAGLGRPTKRERRETERLRGR